MRTILITGSDTGVGKTRVAGALARLLGRDGAGIQIVKAVETGASGEGDAAAARAIAGGRAEAFTLASFSAALAPAAAAAAEGAALSMESLVKELESLPDCDWRIVEGAGGIATPIDGNGRDWADFGAAIGARAVVLVVPDRIGSINQARLARARAAQEDLFSGVWLNAVLPVEAAVAEANRSGLAASGVAIWAEQAHEAEQPENPAALIAILEGGHVADFVRSSRFREKLDRNLTISATSYEIGHTASSSLHDRCADALADRDRRKLRRRLRVAAALPGELNLADNDYLELARDPAVGEAAAAAARSGTSASASPLITGWREEHERLLDELLAWHRFPFGLLWTSGYSANAAVLGELPRRDDRVFADRLVHHSMIAGLLRSGARPVRYPHLDLDRLEALLEGDRSRFREKSDLSADWPMSRPAGARYSRNRLRSNAVTFVVTESVFSMDGDFPDLARLAALKKRHGFFLILDEAHALGWYGPEGSGLAREAGVEAAVDVLVGTLGKTLASGGAYSLFRDEEIRDCLVNFAGEFVYSTALAPPSAAAARAAIGRVRELAPGQSGWRGRSRSFREALRSAGWNAPEGDSAIVPVRLGSEEAALSLAEYLMGLGIRASAVRPPTVSAGTSRLRFSLKRTFRAEDQHRVLEAMAGWRPPR